MIQKSLLYATLITTVVLGLGVWVGYQFGGVGALVYSMWLICVVALAAGIFSILESAEEAERYRCDRINNPDWND